MRNIDVIPVRSEKAFEGASRGVYKFQVSKHANKIEIKNYVAENFKVEVDSVRTLNSLGKVKLFKRRYKGKRSDAKMAYVKLKAGQRISQFDSADEEVEEEPKKKVAKPKKKAPITNKKDK